MRLSLGARLAIAFAVLAALIALIMAGVSSASTNRRVKGDVDQFLLDRAAEISAGSRRPLDRPNNNGNNGNGNNGNGNDPDATTVLDELPVRRAVEADAIVQLLDRKGQLLSSSGIALPIDDADARFFDRRNPALLRTVVIDGESYRMVTLHVDGGGAVQVAQSLSGTNTLLGEIQSELLLLGLAMSVLAGLIGWGIASRTTKPLRRLTNSVESIAASQDLSTEVALDRGDEIGRLSEGFQELLTNLASSREQQHQLVQDAAHELRTPLTSVRANVDFLAHASDLDDESRKAAFGSIKAELSELSDLLAEVVELATESRDAGTFEPVDLVVVAEAALAQFELRSARPVERQMVSTVVLGDAATLTRSIGNLIGNADKYSPDVDAPITVRVDQGTVTVADRGVGIGSDDHERIFERFWRADEARSASGSGLGLAIVKKAVDEHRGQVFARPRHGGGSEIGFSLPTTTLPAATVD